MIVFHTHCQTGNRMFIYACARSLARKKKAFYTLSDIKGLEMFTLTIEDRLFNNFKFLWFRLINLLKLEKYSFKHLQDNRHDYSDVMLEHHTSSTWYYGYFQGEKYFYGNEMDIKACLRIRKKYKTRFEKIYKDLFLKKKVIVVHLRLKDYKTFGPDFLDGPNLTLPLSYYHQLIEKYLNKGKEANYQFIFISDQIEQVKEEFKYVKKAIFSNNSMEIDFQTIMHANICILSNSTFAWWAAWLNNKPDKIIYMPKYFLGFKVCEEYPINIIPRNWNQISIYG